MTRVHAVGAPGLAAVTVAWLLTSACGPNASPPFAPSPNDDLRTVSGVVVDTGNRPIAGAVVRHQARSTTSAADGTFAIVLPAPITRAEFIADGYEPDHVYWQSSSGPVTGVRAVLAPRAVVVSGESLAATLTDGDVPYYVGEAYESDYCRPCQMIRIGGDGGPRRVDLRWAGETEIAMWASEGMSALRAEMIGPRHLSVTTVGGAAHQRIYVGVPLSGSWRGQVRFTLTVD